MRPPKAIAKLGALLLGALLVFNAAAAFAAQDWPRPQTAVADYAKILDPKTKAVLEQAAASLLKTTGASLVVATLPELGDSTVEEEAVKLYEKWGIGKKGESKGLLMLLAVKERRFRVEVGHGLEGLLPDSRVGQIIKGAAIPYFKKNDFNQGLAAGFGGLAEVIAQDAGLTLQEALGAANAKQTLPAKKKGGGFSWLVLLLVLGFLIFNMFRIRGRRGGGSDGLLTGMVLGSVLGNSVGRHQGGGGGGFDDFGGGFGGFGGGMSGGGGGSFDF